MRRLILFRHAKAERATPFGQDFDRPLAERGRSDAALMGKVLADAGLKPDLALVSPARRTRETWEAASEHLQGAEVRQDRKLYNASAAMLRSFVEAAEEEADTLVLVGHNPGIHQLGMDLLVESGTPQSLLDRVREKFPTAAVLVLAVDPAGRGAYEGLYFAKDFGGGADE